MTLYCCELGIKDTTEFQTSALYLEFLLGKEIHGNRPTKLYDRRDDLHLFYRQLFFINEAIYIIITSIWTREHALRINNL